MAVLTVTGLSKSFGVLEILKDVNFEVQKNDHIGFVGINGSGKTTLFKILCGDYISDSGLFVTGKDVNVGYMEQHICRNDGISAYDEVLTVFNSLMKLEKELEAVTSELSKLTGNFDELILKQDRLNDEFANKGGLTYRNRAKSTLIGLGFTEEQIYLPVGVLSGGQKAKLQLAKMLLSGAQLLLLDEPTNHLDITATEWLEDFLKNYNGAYIVISHDRYFLDSVTSKTLELENKRITLYKGNYTEYLRQKAENELSKQRVYENTQKEIKRIEGIIEQQKRFNQERNYITIASKQKSIDRLEATLEKPAEKPDVINFSFKASRRSGNDVLTVKDTSLSFGDNKLFKNVNFEIKRQERVFIIGPNGCGKTSLLKLILGKYTADEGLIKQGVNVDIGYYDQIQTDLDESKDVIDEIWDLHPYMNQTEVRKALAVFLFKGEDVFKPIKGLSGGERARVLLLKLMLASSNLLILDEPTNHLDITSREALEDALIDYDGTMLIVSHDRYLINKLATKVLYLTKDGIDEYIGNYDTYIEKKKAEEEIAEPKETVVKVNEYKLNKERKAAIRKKQNELKRCEQEIENTEAEISDVENMLSDVEIAADYNKTIELSAELQKLKDKDEELMVLWEELNEWLMENGEKEDV